MSFFQEEMLMSHIILQESFVLNFDILFDIWILV